MCYRWYTVLLVLQMGHNVVLLMVYSLVFQIIYRLLEYYRYADLSVSQMLQSVTDGIQTCQCCSQYTDLSVLQMVYRLVTVTYGIQTCHCYIWYTDLSEIFGTKK
ncbi:hypothetical protein CHS0354_006180 [Potamilus streckersoni]|uniref:Uncharacterized protein n=1 Tax=Potamilus streckersoni TaxID=2493646 RepID=A0AAE0WDE7_9BIVA|nr:hypothetical protein CHS0354_006180 [Potamilus streckersoni]